LRPGIREELFRSFEEKINSRAHQAGNPGDADDDIGVGVESPAAKIFFDYEKSYEQADRYENSIGAESDGADVNEREHFCGSLLYTVLEIGRVEGF
jgi:hypothetical protein